MAEIAFERVTGACRRVRVDLRETLGRESYLHFAVDAPPAITAS